MHADLGRLLTSLPPEDNFIVRVEMLRNNSACRGLKVVSDICQPPFNMLYNTLQKLQKGLAAASAQQKPSDIVYHILCKSPVIVRWCRSLIEYLKCAAQHEEQMDATMTVNAFVTKYARELQACIPKISWSKKNKLCRRLFAILRILKKMKTRNDDAAPGTKKKRGGESKGNDIGCVAMFFIGFILIWFPPPIQYAGILMICLSLTSSAAGIDPFIFLIIMN